MDEDRDRIVGVERRAAQQVALARERTLMANERTFLAYTRTSLAVLVAGATLVNFFQILWIRYVGLGMLPLGLLLLLWGLVRYRQNRIVTLRSSSMPLEEDDEKAD